MRIGICDDEEEAVEVAVKLIKSIAKPEMNIEFIIFDNDEKIVNEILSQRIEVMVLDIDMPGKDGIEIGDDLAVQAPELNLIFLTNQVDLVFRAIHCHPFRFIRKSHIEEELPEAITSVMQKIVDEQSVITFQKAGKALVLKIKDILYIESKGHYLEVHERKTIHTVRGKLSDYEKMLKANGFIRIHVGYLVNARRIYCLKKEVVELDNGEKLTVSRSYTKAAREEMSTAVGRLVNGAWN